MSGAFAARAPYDLLTLGTSHAPLAPGTVVGARYELLALLGRGGSGAVYRARQKPLAREVAVKLLLPELVAAPSATARFAREVSLVQQLAHPNTVRLFDFGVTEGGVPFMAMELLRGATLEVLRTSGPMAPARVAHIAMQVLKSLMEAHALGIVHRDIKPANVFLSDYSGEPDFVKVLDFGIARSIVDDEPGRSITRDGQLVGTAAYMAPEQVLGASVGPATDLYALGLTMAEALTGTPVHASGSHAQICMRQASSDAVPLSPLVRESALGPIIARATRKRMSDRYPSAAAMFADLERIAGSPGIPGEAVTKRHVATAAASPTTAALAPLVPTPRPSTTRPVVAPVRMALTPPIAPRPDPRRGGAHTPLATVGVVFLVVLAAAPTVHGLAKKLAATRSPMVAPSVPGLPAVSTAPPGVSKAPPSTESQIAVLHVPEHLADHGWVPFAESTLPGPSVSVQTVVSRRRKGDAVLTVWTYAFADASYMSKVKDYAVDHPDAVVRSEGTIVVIAETGSAKDRVELEPIVGALLREARAPR